MPKLASKLLIIETHNEQQPRSKATERRVRETSGGLAGRIGPPQCRLQNLPGPFQRMTIDNTAVSHDYDGD